MTPQVPRWVRDAVFYQIFPDRFARSPRVIAPGPLEPWDAPPTPSGFKGGDLLGIVERLDELADLGVTALYLTPVFTSASNHRYHTYDYFAVDPMLGGTPALRELVDALHARGMRIVLDGVFNHTGRGFWPFHHIVENGITSPYLDWFHVDRARLEAGQGLQPYPSRLGDVPASGGAKPPSVPTGYRAWWDLPALPKLNTDAPAVRRYLWSVAEHWLRFGIDGWRLDVPTEIADESFWQEFRRRCRAVRDDAYLVGEIWDPAPEWVRGDRFDSLMNYPLLAAIVGFAGGPSLSQPHVDGHHEFKRSVRPLDGAAFGARLEELMRAYEPATVAAMLNLLSSHDTPRCRTILGGDVAAFRLATFLQMTLPGAPCVYYGDEIGMEGGNDPDCRRAFPAGSAGRDESLRDGVRALIAARAEHPALRSDRVRVAGTAGHAIVLERGGEEDATAAGEVLLVAVNAGVSARECDVRLPAFAGGAAKPLALPGFAAHAALAIDAAGGARAALAPRSAAIWRLAPARGIRVSPEPPEPDDLHEEIDPELIAAGYVPPDPNEARPVELWSAVGDVRPWGTMIVLFGWALWFLLSARGGALEDAAAMIAWGANTTGLDAFASAWRSLASTFLHASVTHIFFNATSLLVVAPAVERLFTRWGFWIVYAIGGAAASAASLLWRSAHAGAAASLSVGGSGAIFALGGALLLAALRLHGRLAPSRARALAAALLYLLAPALASGLTRHGTDNVAHAAGLAGGVFLGAVLPLSPRLGGPPTSMVLRALSVLCALALAVSLALSLRGGIGYVP